MDFHSFSQSSAYQRIKWKRRYWYSLSYSCDWYQEISIVRVPIYSFTHYSNFYLVKLHWQTPTLKPVCKGERQFVPFVRWVLVWPAQRVTPWHIGYKQSLNSQYIYQIKLATSRALYKILKFHHYYKQLFYWNTYDHFSLKKKIDIGFFTKVLITRAEDTI